MTLTATHTAALLTRREQFVARGVASAHPLFAVRAEGSRVWDVDGCEYLDFAGGIGVVNVGHNHPQVIAAVREQLDRYVHTCFQVVMYEPYVRLAERLARLVGRGRPMKTFFATTGAEAVENAIKIARAATGRPAIVAFNAAFHGRTLMGMTLTGMSVPYKQTFGPFAPDVYHAPYPYVYRDWTVDRALAGLEELFTSQVTPDRVAAILIEPQLGDGGFVPAPSEYLRRLKSLAQQHGIVLIFDEIQTGFGRTSRMFAFEHAGIAPDLVVLAKGLADGFPLSAVVGRSDLMDAPEPGGLGGTYAGHPLACAAALAVLDLFEDGSLLARADRLGSVLREGLTNLAEKYECIGDVRGLGPMLAIELVQDRRSKQPDATLTTAVLRQARARGLIVIRCGLYQNVVRLLPPLVATDTDACRALQILAEAILAALAERQ